MLPQDDKHVSNRFRKYLGIAAIVIRDIDGIGFSRARTQVDRIAPFSVDDTKKRYRQADKQQHQHENRGYGIGHVRVRI